MYYNSFHTAMQRRFGCKVYRLALDGGMTCPNRDGTLGNRGCTFCGEGAGAFAEKPCGSVAAQLEAARKRVAEKIKNGKYVAYFQSYTNTYAPVAKLERLFQEAMEPADIVALAIATRPDCLPTEVLSLLRRLAAVKPIWVELGLQTADDDVARAIRRSCPTERFSWAADALHKVGAEVIMHQILGLPGEDQASMQRTAAFIGAQCDGIKLHLLHVLRGTDLAADYAAGRFKTLELPGYIELLQACIQRLPRHVVIHRLTGDGAKKDLIAPLWSADKKKVLNAIRQAFLRDNTEQGSDLGMGLSAEGTFFG